MGAARDNTGAIQRLVLTFTGCNFLNNIMTLSSGSGFYMNKNSFNITFQSTTISGHRYTSSNNGLFFSLSLSFPFPFLSSRLIFSCWQSSCMPQVHPPRLPPP